MVNRWGVTLLAFCFVSSAILAAEEPGVPPYYAEKERGWYWREPIPLPEPETKAEEPSSEHVSPPEPIVSSSPEPAPFSAAWMRDALPKYRDAALENPTPENVRAYFLLQRYGMDMAERFALTAQRVVMSDPMLDENNRRPISSYGARVFDEVAREASEQVARDIAGSAGIWYFYRSDCPYCKAQNPILKRISERLGFAVLPIALDGLPMPDGAYPIFVPDRGHARELQVTQTPTLFLVKQGEFAQLSEGLVTDENLVGRIVAAAHEAGWITDQQFESTRPVNGTTLVVDSDAVHDTGAVTPEELAQILKIAPR